MAEIDYFRYNEPYYKVYPGMVEQLGGVNIDIDGQYLKLPFPAFEVRLPKGEHVVTDGEGGPICTAMMVSADNITRHCDGRDWSIICMYQFDGIEHGTWLYKMSVKKGKTIGEEFEEAFVNSELTEGLYDPPKKLADKLIRIAIATCFFGTRQHDLIIPDIPAKLRDKYAKAKAENNDFEVKQILDKSKRLGHNGYRIGSEIAIPKPQSYLGGDGRVRDYEPTGRELQYGHVRSAYMRLQPKGKRSDPYYELTYVAPTIVRPDLPMKETRGFKIE
jgi:hypothetical protein